MKIVKLVHPLQSITGTALVLGACPSCGRIIGETVALVDGEPQVFDIHAQPNCDYFNDDKTTHAVLVLEMLKCDQSSLESN